MDRGVMHAGPIRRAVMAAAAGLLASAMLGGMVRVPVDLVGPAASSEATGSDGTIDRLYRAFFLREPDVAGYDHWRSTHRNGYPLTAISEDFARSSEFQSRYGAVSHRDFVTLTYRNVLERSPDATGFAHWVAELENRGMSRGVLMIHFADSAEFRSRTTGEGPRTSEPMFDRAFGATSAEALELLDFLDRHEIQAVRLSATVDGLSRDDLRRVDDTSVALFVPGTCVQFCEGDAYELLFRDVDAVPDANVFHDSGAWEIKGRFVVTSVQIGTGGVYSVALRAVPIA